MVNFYQDDKFAADFVRQYESDPDFQERSVLWRKLIDKYAVGKKRALDVGCGSGILSAYLAEKGLEVVAVDSSAAMIEKFRKGNSAGAQIRFHVEEIPFRNPSVFGLADIIVSSSVLEYVQDLDRAMMQLRDALAPHGVLIISFPNKNSIFRKFESLKFSLTGSPTYLGSVHHHFTVNGLKKYQERFGFVMEEFHYYAHNKFISRLCRLVLPSRFSENLFVAVFRKKELSV